MTLIRQRPPASVAVTKAAIAQATATLNELPERPKASWSLREAVNQLQGSITTALDRGYSYEEVSELLAKKGVSITASSLKRYLASAKKDNKTGTVKKTRKPRTTKAAKADAKAAPAPAATEAAAEAAPKRRSRAPGKAKAAAEPKAAKAPRGARKAAAAPARAAAKVKQPKSTTRATTTRGTRGRKKASAE